MTMSMTMGPLHDDQSYIFIAYETNHLYQHTDTVLEN
jgi:hypothetical protein